MRTTFELLNDIIALGIENRLSIVEEKISDELYDTILLGFKCEKEA